MKNIILVILMVSIIPFHSISQTPTQKGSRVRLYDPSIYNVSGFMGEFRIDWEIRHISFGEIYYTLNISFVATPNWIFYKGERFTSKELGSELFERLLAKQSSCYNLSHVRMGVNNNNFDLSCTNSCNLNGKIGKENAIKALKSHPNVTFSNWEAAVFKYESDVERAVEKYKKKGEAKQYLNQASGLMSSFDKKDLQTAKSLLIKAKQLDRDIEGKCNEMIAEIDQQLNQIDADVKMQEVSQLTNTNKPESLHKAKQILTQLKNNNPDNADEYDVKIDEIDKLIAGNIIDDNQNNNSSDNSTTQGENNINENQQSNIGYSSANNYSETNKNNNSNTTDAYEQAYQHNQVLIEQANKAEINTEERIKSTSKIVNEGISQIMGDIAYQQNLAAEYRIKNQQRNKRVKRLTNISYSIKDPRELIAAYNRQMEELKDEIEQQKEEDLKAINAIWDRKREKMHAQAKNDIEGGIADLFGALGEGAEKKKLRKLMEQRIEEAEEKLDNALREKMDNLKDEYTDKQKKAQSQYLKAAIYAVDEQQEDYYLQKYKYHKCVLDYTNKNYHYSSADWLNANCQSVSEKYFSTNNYYTTNDYLNAAKRKYKKYKNGESIEFKNASLEFVNTALALNNKMYEAYAFRAKISDSYFEKLSDIKIANYIVTSLRKKNEENKSSQLSDCKLKAKEIADSLYVNKGEDQMADSLYYLQRIDEITDSLYQEIEVEEYNVDNEKLKKIINEYQEIETRKYYPGFKKEFYQKIQSGDIRYVKKVIKNKLYAGIEDKNKRTPLQYAIFVDQPYVMRVFIREHKIIQEIKIIQNLFTLSVINDAPKCASSLSKDYRAKTSFDADDMSYLLLASMKQNAKIFSVLLNNDLELSKTIKLVELDKYNTNKIFFYTTAIKYAIDNNNLELAEKLTSNNNNIHKYSFLENKNKEISVFDYCFQKENNDILFIFAKYGASLNQKDEKGNTPLNNAILNENSEMAKALIGGKVDLNIKNSKNWAPLHLSVWKGDIEITSTLLGNSAKVNIQGENGWTALHFAVRENNQEMIKLLIKNGANKNIKDKWNRKPIHIARERFFNKVKKLLR